MGKKVFNNMIRIKLIRIHRIRIHIIGSEEIIYFDIEKIYQEEAGSKVVEMIDL